MRCHCGVSAVGLVTRAGGLRGGLGIGGVILGLVVGMGVILLVMGLWKRFAREALPVLVHLPGGAWVIGGGLGVVTVLGVAGWLRCASGVSDRTRMARGCMPWVRRSAARRRSGRSSFF